MNAGLRRRLATGTNALLVTVLLVATVMLVLDLAGRFKLRVDLSQDGAATLQDDTVAALATVDAGEREVTVTAFSAQLRNDEALQKNRLMRDLLRELGARTANLETRFVDFDGDRRTANELGVTQYGTVVVESAGRRVDIKEREVFRHSGKGKDRLLDFRGESLIARAIVQVALDSPRRIYVLAGHGERRFDEPAPEGISAWVELLVRQGWDVDTLDLLRDREPEQALAVPEDANAVLVVAPTGALAEPEEEALRAFLKRGGAVGLYLEPGSAVPDLAEDVGVVLPSGIVHDVAVVWPNDDWPVLNYGEHLVTEDLRRLEQKTLVARAAPVRVTPREGVRSETLLRSSRRGWIERGSERPSVYDETQDEIGPVDAVVALTIFAPHPLAPKGDRARVLVSGDASLVTDELVDEGPGNGTFAVNTVRWLLGDDDRMSRVGRPKRMRQLELEPGDLTRIGWLTMGAMPLSVLLLGLGVAFLRRPR